MLSHPVPIEALVSHYLTNKLVGRGLLQGRNHTFDPKMLSGITCGFPQLFRTLGQIIHALLSLTPLSVSCKQETSRTTCMPNPRRQRSF